MVLTCIFETAKKMAALEGSTHVNDVQPEHVMNHNLIAPSDNISLEKQAALAKLQARFRGDRDRCVFKMFLCVHEQ
jgi:hypothetical protein